MAKIIGHGHDKTITLPILYVPLAGGLKQYRKFLKRLAQCHIGTRQMVMSFSDQFKGTPNMHRTFNKGAQLYQ